MSSLGKRSGAAANPRSSQPRDSEDGETILSIIDRVRNRVESGSPVPTEWIKNLNDLVERRNVRLALPRNTGQYFRR